MKKIFCLRQLLRKTSATLRAHAFRKFLTPMLTRSFRDPYLEAAPHFMKKRFMPTSTLTPAYAHLTHTCVLEVPYANAYATLTRSLRPQCFLMVLTQVLPRGLRLPYAAMAPPYARMFCLRQFLRAAYATPTPLHF